MSANCDSTFCKAGGPKGAELALRKMPRLNQEKREAKNKKHKKNTTKNHNNKPTSIEELLPDKD